MNQDKIVVVMGGPSTEAEISRQTGSAILKALQSKGYNAEGMELNPPTFAEDIKKSGCAIVFNALHGKFGEDGVLQGTLDMLGIPYTARASWLLPSRWTRQLRSASSSQRASRRRARTRTTAMR